MDLVYTWVNGSEPELEVMKAHYQELSPLYKAAREHPEKPPPPRWPGSGIRDGGGRQKRDISVEQSMNRFRDMNELKYSVRSVAHYAASGMFTKIHILTTEVIDAGSGERRGQVPQWLDLEKAVGKVQLVPHSMVYDHEEDLPSFNSLSIESQMHHIPGMAHIYVYLNDDVFFGKTVGFADFWTPLFGFVFHVDGTSKVAPSPPMRIENTTFVDDRSSLQHTNSILSKQFGARHRAHVAHIPHILSVPIMDEIQALWPEEFANTGSHRFRGEGGGFEIQASFLLAHYVMERLRETQLTSWWRHRLDKNQDGLLDLEERQELVRMVDRYNQLQTENRRFSSYLKDYKERLQSVGIPWTNETEYLLTGMDEYPFMLGAADLRKSSRYQNNRPYRTSEHVRTCKFEIDFCLGTEFRNITIKTLDASTGKGSMFERLAFTEFHCGDCLLHVVRQTSPTSGMDALLPPDRDSEAYREVLTDLAKYNYVAGKSRYSFIQLETGLQAQAALDKLIELRDNQTYLCINDDVQPSPLIVKKVRTVFSSFLDQRFSIPSPWEKPG